ncbi:MAG: aspartate kinase [Wenzhouxiangella sp.]
MKIIVQKYGGSSLADDAQLRAVAKRIQGAYQQGQGLVVVVSARGDTTSRLLAIAGRLNASPGHRELDMLLAAGEQTSASLLTLALQNVDVPACAMTGPQAGVRTCDAHLNARIREVDPRRILAALDQGKVVVVAGFQGASPAGDITTLGRGGSDTTAVAIAAAIGAARCEIYSDVDGVYTADPRLVPKALRLSLLSLAEMKTLAHHGAGVLNERAIDYALRFGVTVHARRAHGEGGQTVVRAEAGNTSGRVVGIAAQRDLIRVRPAPGPDSARLAEVLSDYEMFLPELAAAREPQYLLTTEQLADAGGLAQSLRQACAGALNIEQGLGSVSAVGYQVGRDAELRDFVRGRLEASGIEVLASYARDHAVVGLLKRDQVEAAAQALHAALRIADSEVAHVA